MDFAKELAELQDTLAITDFNTAVERANRGRAKGMMYLIVKELERIRIKIDGNKNHKRPHLHIDYGREYHAASFAIDTGERIAGDLDIKYNREVHSWIVKHKPKLLQAWELMQAGKDATPIASELRRQ